MKTTLNFVFATAGALLTAGLMAAVLSWIDVNEGLNVYAFSAWSVIPVGAIGLGLIAALGYLAGSRLFHLRADNWVLALPILTAITTFFGTHYLNYQQFEVYRIRVASFMSFQAYFRTVFIKGTYAGPGRVYDYDYGLSVLQVAGFAAAGLLVHRKLRRRTFCSRSWRYMKKTETISVPFTSSDEYTNLAEPAHALAKEGKVDEIRSAYTNTKHFVGKVKKPNYRSTAKFYRCRRCQVEHAVLSEQKRRGPRWVSTGSSPASPNLEFVGQPDIASESNR